MDYQFLTLEEQQEMINNRLRALELEHFQASISSESAEVLKERLGTIGVLIVAQDAMKNFEYVPMTAKPRKARKKS